MGNRKEGKNCRTQPILVVITPVSEEERFGEEILSPWSIKQIREAEARLFPKVLSSTDVRELFGEERSHQLLQDRANSHRGDNIDLNS